MKGLSSNYSEEEVDNMLTCREHVKEAIRIMDVPHIRKAPAGVKCSFCNQKALHVSYINRPCKFKISKQFRENIAFAE